MDEVDMPYRAFLEQFKGDIVKRIMKDKGWTLTKAKNYLSSKFNYDDYIYSIMCDLVNEGKKIIINRNPQSCSWDYNNLVNYWNIYQINN